MWIWHFTYKHTESRGGGTPLTMWTVQSRTCKPCVMQEAYLMPTQCEQGQGQVAVGTGANLVWVTAAGSVCQGGCLVGAAETGSCGPSSVEIFLLLLLLLLWLILSIIRPVRWNTLPLVQRIQTKVQLYWPATEKIMWIFFFVEVDLVLKIQQESFTGSETVTI